MFFGTAVCCISPWVECSKLQEDENLRLNYTQGHMNHSSTRKEACHNASPSYVVVCCVALVGQLMMILHQGNYSLIVWNQNLIPQNDNKIKYHPPHSSNSSTVFCIVAYCQIKFVLPTKTSVIVQGWLLVYKED